MKCFLSVLLSSTMRRARSLPLFSSLVQNIEGVGKGGVAGPWSAGRRLTRASRYEPRAAPRGQVITGFDASSIPPSPLARKCAVLTGGKGWMEGGEAGSHHFDVC